MLQVAMISKKKAFIRQFLVSAGVSLSMMEHSLVMGYTAMLLPQLRSHPEIRLDDSSASWIASIVGLCNTVGIICVPPLISRYGRRCANLISAIIMVIGWACIASASNTATILFARAIQGVGLGISSLTSAVLVGEYTTPKYRGAFLTMLSFSILLGALMVHTIGSCLNWTNTAFLCLAIAVLDTSLISISPESPAFLANCGRYDECRKVFHWLKGSYENEELEAMIKANLLNKAQSKVDAKEKIRDIIFTMKQSRFFKPIVIMLHLHWCQILSGILVMDVYGVDVFHVLIGEDINILFVLTSMDIVKIASTILAIILNIKIRRRLMAMIFLNLNILLHFIIAAYCFAKAKQWLIIDHPYIGMALSYLLMFTIAAGTTSIVNTISGEIFPLKYKNVSVAITTFAMSLSVALALKTLPYFLLTIGLHGTLCLYGVLLFYAMLVVVTMLPETKGLTLQSIEEYWQKPAGIDLEQNRLVTMRT